MAEQMIKYEGCRNISNQFLTLNRQMRKDMVDIVNAEIATRLEGGRRMLRLMHRFYKAFGQPLHALYLSIDKKDGRVWVTGHTGDMKVETVTSSPMEDLDNYYLAQLIDEALYDITKEDDGTSGLLDADKYEYPKKFCYSCA